VIDMDRSRIDKLLVTNYNKQEESED